MTKRQAEEPLAQDNAKAHKEAASDSATSARSGGQMSLSDICKLDFFEENMDKVEVIPNTVDKKTFYKVIYPTSLTKRKKPTEVRLFAPAMATAFDSKLTNEGNFGSQYAKKLLEAKFQVGCAFYAKPARADEVNPKTGRPYVNMDTFINNQKRYMEALRRFDKIIHQKLWDLAVFQGKEKRVFFDEARVAIANEKRHEDYKAKKAAGEKAKKPGSLQYGNKKDMAIVEEDFANNPGWREEAQDRAFANWYADTKDTKRTHILRWDESKDLDVENPTYTRMGEDEQQQPVEVETRMMLFFNRPVYEMRRVATKKDDFAAVMQARMLARRHPLCATFDKDIAKEVTELVDGKSVTSMKTFPYVYAQPDIIYGREQASLKYDPTTEESPILPGAVVQVQHGFKINESALSVGLRVSDFQRVFRVLQGERVVSEAKMETDGVDVEDEDDDTPRPAPTKPAAAVAAIPAAVHHDYAPPIDDDGDLPDGIVEYDIE